MILLCKKFLNHILKGSVCPLFCCYSQPFF
nr:MAG TPA: hypothetical protein [Caudoviricetes sp.]